MQSPQRDTSSIARDSRTSVKLRQVYSAATFDARLGPGAPDLVSQGEDMAADRPILRRRLWWLSLVALWVVPIAVLLIFADALALATWVPASVLSWDKSQGHANLTQILGLAVIWTVVVVGLRLWLPLRPYGSTSPSQHRIRYFYILIVGLGVITLAGPNLLQQSGLASASRVGAQVIVLSIAWVFVVFLLLVFFGDNSHGYRRYLYSYRTVWTLLALTLMSTAVVNIGAYQSVLDRVTGLRATVADAQTELDALAGTDEDVGTAYYLEHTAYHMLEAVDGYYKQTLAPTPVSASSQATNSGTPQGESPVDCNDIAQPQANTRPFTRDEFLQQVSCLLPNLRYYAGVSESEARVALGLTDVLPITSGDTTIAPQPSPTPGSGSPGLLPSTSEPTAQLPASQGAETASAIAPTATPRATATPSDPTRAWLVEPRTVIRQTDDRARAVELALDKLDDELRMLRSDPSRTVEALDRIVGDEVYSNAAEVNQSAPVAQKALRGVDVPVVALFVWIGVFYALLLFAPSMLLLLFFFRKRDQRAAQIMLDLVQLDPTHGLLVRALGLAADSDTEPHSGGENGQQTHRGSRERERVASAIKELRGIRNQDDPGVQLLQSQSAVQPVIERLAARAFSNLEYALALVLLNTLLALGWYFVFYPRTTAGLAILIASGAGVAEVTSYLATPSPITYGFVGSYFWIIQMLLRRYFSGDLYPSAFLQASERLILVFILSLVFTIADFAVGVTNGVSVLAFAAGVYPRAGLRQILTFANKLLGRELFPTTIENIPLTQLDGIDVWIEARLVEEKVENVQSLATASLELLVLRTHFPTAQIIDWVDQAILYLHAGYMGYWYPSLRMAGIRGAADLLDAAGVLVVDAQGQVNPEKPPCEKLARRIAAAIRVAPMTVPQDTPKPARPGQARQSGSSDASGTAVPAAAQAATAGAAAGAPDQTGADRPEATAVTTPDAADVRSGSPDAPAPPAGNSGAQVQEKSDSAVDAQPPDLTDTLVVICDSLWPDPNMRYVLSFMGYRLPEPPKPPTGTLPLLPAPGPRPLLEVLAATIDAIARTWLQAIAAAFGVPRERRRS